MFKRARYARTLSMRISISVLLLALLPASVPGVVAAQETPAFDGVEWAQLTIHERIMIRIPRRARPLARRGRRFAPPPPDLPTVWSERKAPKCIPVTRLTGEAAVQGGDVDLMLVDGRRLRAKLNEDCPALDFYSGFYLKPNADGLICGGRDVLRARSGAACPIARFRRLVAQR